MHRIIMNCPKGMYVDHRNGNGLDNRRCNLRICDRKGNAQNVRKKDTVGLTSKYKGVSLASDSSGRWEVGINVDKKHTYLGRFDSEVDAAKCYDRAAMSNYGEFANLNFPELMDEYLKDLTHTNYARVLYTAFGVTGTLKELYTLFHDKSVGYPAFIYRLKTLSLEEALLLSKGAKRYGKKNPPFLGDLY